MNNNDTALKFVAAEPNSGAHDVNPMDSDLASWMMMSGDLLGSSRSSMFDVPLPMEDDLLGPIPPFYGGSEVLDEETTVKGEGAKTSPEATTKTETDKTATKAKSPRGRKPKKIKAKAGAAATTATVAAKPAVQIKAEKKQSSSKNPDDKRQRRLEKNREIARNCRKRKREKYQKLEEEVVKLRNWNKQLELQLNQGKDGRDKEITRKQELNQMRDLIEKKCSESEMKQTLGQYKSLYSDFGRERSAAISFHMNQLKNLLIPNTVSKMTLWSLQQDDEFYDEKKNEKTFGGGIWNMLCQELRLTTEQKKTLLSMRHGIRTQRRNVAECLRILKELDDRVKSNFQNMGNQMETVMGSITPTQQARFLLWIERNQACSFMLNNMWNQASDDLSASDDASSTVTGLSETAASSTSTITHKKIKLEEKKERTTTTTIKTTVKSN